MKKGKACRISGVVLKMLLVYGKVAIEWMTNLFNKITAESKVPEDQDMSITGHCFKNKGDATERGNYKELKLLEHMVMEFDSVNKQKI